MRRFRRILCGVLALGMILWALSGCNTWAGVGQDIQRGGEAIEDSAS